MSVEFDRGSPGKFDSRTLNRETLSRWIGRKCYIKLFTRYRFTTNNDKISLADFVLNL